METFSTLKVISSVTSSELSALMRTVEAKSVITSRAYAAAAPQNSISEVSSRQTNFFFIAKAPDRIETRLVRLYM